MKNEEIYTIARAYMKVRGEEKDAKVIKLPAKVAWARRVNMDKIMSAAKLIEEAITEIRDRYISDEKSEAFKAEDGSEGRKIKPEFMEEFRKENEDLLNQDTDISIKKVKIEDLGDVELSDDDMDTLMFMIEEEE